MDFYLVLQFFKFRYRFKFLIQVDSQSLNTIKLEDFDYEFAHNFHVTVYFVILIVVSLNNPVRSTETCFKESMVLFSLPLELIYLFDSLTFEYLLVVKAYE